MNKWGRGRECILFLADMNTSFVLAELGCSMLLDAVLMRSHERRGLNPKAACIAPVYMRPLRIVESS